MITFAQLDTDRRRYRSRLEIVMNILQQCEESGANITQIILECGLSHTRAKRILEQLIGRGLLRQSRSRPRRYVITPKGERFWRSVAEALSLLEGRRRQGTVTRRGAGRRLV